MVPAEQDNFILDLERYSKKQEIPIIETEVKKFLEVILKIHKPKRILEVGTAIGYSALIFSRALNHEVYIKTFEKRQDMVQQAKNNFKRFQEHHDVNLSIDVVQGDAREILTKEEKKYDLIFIDAGKAHYQKFLNQVIENLNDGGLIISDNVLFKGMIATDEYVVRRKITIVKRMRAYLEYITTHEKLDTTIIPIGDGVSISYYNGGSHE